MANVIHGDTDATVNTIKEALEMYEREHDHPPSEASLYRQNPGSIRVRIVDPRFEGMSRSRRHQQAIRFLADHVQGDALDEVSHLLLLTPHERGSFINHEFENPLQSNL